MIEVLLFAAGLIVGGAVGWLWSRTRQRADHAQHAAALAGIESSNGELRHQLDEHKHTAEQLRESLSTIEQARTAAETRLEQSLKSFAEQRKLLEDAQTQLKDAFTALSVKALRSNSEEFAKQIVEKVKPLGDALTRYEAEIKKIEEARNKAYGGVTDQLKQLAETQRTLSKQTTSLTTALRAPQVKGRWGEITLRRAVELAGMSPYCDFVEQGQTDDAASRLRPDLIVKLPGDRSIVVDSKASTSDYLDAVEATSEEARRSCLQAHARAVRQHMQNLATKRYWSQFDHSPEFVIMFVPGEAFFSAALEQNRDLIEEGIHKKVILASPTTLVALLQSTAHDWRQQEQIQNAEQIGVAARLLYDRVCTFAEHLGKVGDALRRATEAYNKSVGSWESRLLPMGGKLEDLGVSAKNQDKLELPAIDSTPRALPDSVALAGEREVRPQPDASRD